MDSKPFLKLVDIKAIAAASEAEALRNDWAVTITIVDDGGHPLYLQRLDNASPGSAEIALSKARTAAVLKRPTRVLEERVNEGKTALLKMPGVLPLEGGEPILIEGQCIGAVGVSGRPSHEDAQVARAGIEALG